MCVLVMAVGFLYSITLEHNNKRFRNCYVSPCPSPSSCRILAPSEKEVGRYVKQWIATSELAGE